MDEKGKGNVVAGGRQTHFWKYVWMDECALKISFPNLYRICHKLLKKLEK